MHTKKDTKKNDETRGDGQHRVQPHSRRASLVNEFCLDKHGNDIKDIEAADDLTRQTLAPCDFARTTVTVAGDEGSEDESSARQMDLTADNPRVPQT
jgi:hypothetical protein